MNEKISLTQVKTTTDFAIENMNLQRKIKEGKDLQLNKEIKKMLDENQADEAATYWLEIQDWKFSEDKELVGPVVFSSELNNINKELLDLIKTAYSSEKNISSEETSAINKQFKDTLTFPDGSIGTVFDRTGSAEADDLKFETIQIMIPTEKITKALKQKFTENYDELVSEN